MNIISPQESVPVQIGSFTIYCEKFKVTRIKNFSEQNTVSGNEIITNSGKKAIRIFFSGRISGDNQLNFIVDSNTLICSSEKFSVEYKNIVFGQCQVQSFVVDDQNNNFISATITLISSEVSLKSGDDS
mgnify:FL=1